jgi:hypothetical protein
MEQLMDTLGVDVTSVADVIQSKKAARSEQDRAVLPILRQVLERFNSKERPGPDVGF